MTNQSRSLADAWIACEARHCPLWGVGLHTQNALRPRHIPAHSTVADLHTKTKEQEGEEIIIDRPR
jgi:hypothetical protein